MFVFVKCLSGWTIPTPPMPLTKDKVTTPEDVLAAQVKELKKLRFDPFDFMLYMSVDRLFYGKYLGILCEFFIVF